MFVWRGEAWGMPESRATVFGQKLPDFTVGGILLALLILWMIFIVGSLNLPFLNFAQQGVYPRTLHGLWGIVTSPLVHGNLSHILANSIALFWLLLFVGWEARSRAWLVVGEVWVLSGLGTWIVGREAMHIGASGVVFGLITYLISAGVWAGHWRSFLIGVIVLFFFGGVLWGILPTDGHISWEAHLSGSLAGVFVAWQTYERKPKLAS